MVGSWRSAAHRPTERVGRAAALAALVLGLGWIATPSAHAQLGRALDTPAAAAPSSGTPSGWSFDLSAQTSVPLSVGAEATLTTPAGLFFYLAGGHTPNAYLNVASGILRGAGVYREDLQPIVDEAIANGAWNVRLGGGFTLPVGLELSFGYTMLTGDSALSAEAIEAGTGQRLRWPGMTEIPISITIHALHGRVGWRFVVDDHLVLRVALGWTHEVGNEVDAEVPQEVRDLPGDPAGSIESDVSDGIAEYGFSPELLLSVGYRF
ncbi:MAG: hypothetical protein EVA89_01590 [Sandaracinaceae bacterium]|nr:MAG: hypothetical protein EVA89_01590 [Sandaracinaceae bacterium]